MKMLERVSIGGGGRKKKKLQRVGVKHKTTKFRKPAFD